MSSKSTNSASRHFAAAVPSLDDSMSSTVAFLIGRDNKVFVLHKELLVRVSRYLDLASTEDWTERVNRTYILDDVNIQVFELFVRWLYTKRIELRDSEDSDQFLIHAWALGDRLQCRLFKNAVIDALHDDWKQWRDEWPSIDTTELVYQVSPPRSKIRDLILASWSLHSNAEVVKWMDNTALLSEEFYDDFIHNTQVLEEVRSGQLNVDPRTKFILEEDVCRRFHEHTPEEPVCREPAFGTSTTFHDDEAVVNRNEVFPF